MSTFGAKTHGQCDAIVLLQTKAHGIRFAILGKPRAASVAEITRGFQFFFRRTYVFVSGRRAAAFVAIAKRQARAMRPEFGIASFLRDKVWTSQGELRVLGQL